jgi:hypothetical protein
MKKIFIAAVALITFCNLSAQTKETSQELSKGAKKGMLVDAVFAEDGNIKLTFKNQF